MEEFICQIVNDGTDQKKLLVAGNKERHEELHLRML